MLFEVAFDVTPREVTPQEGKGALGAWWTSLAALGEGLRTHKSGGRCDVERWSKPVALGVYVGQRLSFGAAGKARSRAVAKVANRTREIRPSGMKTGARGNATHGGTRNPIRNRKSGLGHSSPTGARASVLSKQARPARGEPARAGSDPCDGAGDGAGEA